jgi:hypothetical protein
MNQCEALALFQISARDSSQVQAMRKRRQIIVKRHRVALAQPVSQRTALRAKLPQLNLAVSLSQ